MTLHKLLPALLLGFSGMCAHAQFAPGVVNHTPTASERTRGNTIKSEALCRKRNGQWEKGPGYAYCILPYADAGKICKNSKDCIGHCIAPVTDERIDHGTCQIDDSTDDCGRPHFENGKVIYFNCD
jgi:hypothetical protein